MIYIILFALLLLFGNTFVLRSRWYKSLFHDIRKFQAIPNDLQVVNLGSNSGIYAFDYSGLEMRGMNWAVGPQSLEFDKLILEQNNGCLTSGGIVIIPICPFSSLLGRYEKKEFYDKYHLILSAGEIPYYSVKTKWKMLFFLNVPIFYAAIHPKSFILSFIKPSRNSALSINTLADKELQNDAKVRMNNWKKEFGIKEPGAPLTVKQKETIAKNQEYLMDMIETCHKKDLYPLIVILPLTRYLGAYFTPDVKKCYIDNFVTPVVEKTKVPFLDYMGIGELEDERLYFNSLFLNVRGRKIFTKRILFDIDIIQRNDSFKK